MIKSMTMFAALTLAIATFIGCAAPVELRVSVHDRITSEPVKDAHVIARYYAPKLRSQPPGAVGRTDENGDVVLRLVERDLPMSVTITAPGHSHSELGSAVSLKNLIASGELFSPDDWYPNRTLDVVLQAVRPAR